MVDIFTNPAVEKKFSEYPARVRKQMLALRKLLLQVANESAGGECEETLRWSEPAWIVKGGSTVRMDWKESSPEEFCLYFNCQTKLIETFRELYGDVLKLEGNRAIVLQLNEAIPEDVTAHCLQLAFEYHKRKHLPLLGV